jgi:hypothetical protein
MFRVLVPTALLIAAAIGLTPIAGAAGPYNNCSQAKADGVCNITQDSLPRKTRSRWRLRRLQVLTGTNCSVR